MQQPSLGSPHVSHSLARVPDRHVSSGGWGSSVSRNLSRAPSRGEALSEFCSDLQLLIPDRGENGGEIEKASQGKYVRVFCVSDSILDLDTLKKFC